MDTEFKVTGEASREIIENVKNIFSIPKGSVPSARSLGLDMSFIDRNPLAAKPLIIATLHEAIKAEPRAEITEINITAFETQTKVTVKIRDRNEGGN